MILLLLAFLAAGLYCAWNAPADDNEKHHFRLDWLQQTKDHYANFGEPMPARLPWRLPAEYWLYDWCGDLFTGRVLGLMLGSCGFWLTVAYAESLAGTTAGLLAGAIILSSPTMMRALSSATYVPPVATLWVGGLYALHIGHPGIAAACGVLLALLRATSWGMALWLLLASGGLLSIPVIVALGAYLWFEHPKVVLAQGWALRLRGKVCNVRGYPRDGWVYALVTAVRRFEAWGAWGLAALIIGRWTPESPQLAVLTVAVVLATHLPRILYRPKWVLGYLLDFMLPVAVALAVVIA